MKTRQSQEAILTTNEALVLQQVYKDGGDDAAILAAQMGMPRRTAMHVLVDLQCKGLIAIFAERVHGAPVQQLTEFLVVEHLDLLDLVRGPEPVEVVQKGHPSLDGRQVRHPRQVRHLLDAARGEQRKPGLTARHDVGLVPEDREGVGSQS